MHRCTGQAIVIYTDYSIICTDYIHEYTGQIFIIIIHNNIDRYTGQIIVLIIQIIFSDMPVRVKRLSYRLYSHIYTYTGQIIVNGKQIIYTHIYLSG